MISHENRMFLDSGYYISYIRIASRLYLLCYSLVVVFFMHAMFILNTTTTKLDKRANTNT